MLDEISRDYYCVADELENGLCKACGGACAGMSGLGCGNCRRKHPTPEQFKEEYGREWPDDGAVWERQVCVKDGKKGNWYAACDGYGDAKRHSYAGTITQIVCACAPFGKPGNDWRPV